ncbi:hypothetical protein DH2020_039051 [Rehmannia glutinosa]|uniref:BZIP domain-containing protein n=1 Tax=Rehmannia glutinosa TaxID=99300 RepID=A0ABR0UWX0_REHGL
MADATVVSVDPPPLSTTDYDCGLSVPPFDAAFFSQHLFDDDDGSQGDNQNDIAIDDLDFDFSFDDLYLPSADDLDDLLTPNQILEFGSQHGQDANFPHFGPNLDQFHAVSKSNSEELRHISAGAISAPMTGVLNYASLGLEPHQSSSYLNVPSPESNGSNRETSENCGGDAKVSNWPSPESRGSGNFRSNISEDSNNCVTRSVSSSPNLNTRSIRTGVVNQKVKLEEPSKRSVNSSLLKRKKDCEDLPSSTVESSKCRKSNCNPENSNNNNNIGGLSEEEEKRKARLIRNRESAQLSRQRKKHYVDELEEKVRMMHSTIQDLNVKISYFMAENATLRQQMGGGGAVPPPPMAPQPPGMYPHPAMMYPWMPCAPPYMVKPQGSQVPLVPIPKLKPQQPVQAPKVRKKAESKKNEGPKTKKVASVSFLGLLFFIMLFGGLVPMVNMRYGGIRETLTGGESYVGGGFYEKHHGRVLMVNGTEYGEKHSDRRDFSTKSSVHCDQRGHDSGGKPNVDESVRLCNESEPLVASLYVPRNDKLVKIDGNLIIHSVLASERAMNGKGGVDTGLALPGDLGPSIHVPGVRRSGDRHPQLRALGSGSADEVGRKPTDGRLQQWFREGLAGPMLSSGMCTEVFKFDVSSASASSGAIVPATTITTRNISEEQNQNSTHLNKGRNRRILRGLPIPLPESSHNISRQHTGRNSQKENLNVNNTVSPMVVSVLVDPREAGDADVDGVIGGAKSLSRIFVVVLVDSVKYVTYSCMLPFKGSVTHLVTT